MTLGEDRGTGARPVRVRRLTLTDFRSYPRLELDVGAAQVALTGDNGAGKTNLLEALSLFAPGRGLRRAEFLECAHEGGSGGWAVSIEIEGDGGRVQLGTGVPASGSGAPGGRRNRIDRAAAGSSGSFSEWIRLVWLTPEMDLLFLGPPGDRRRFLDRLVLAIDPRHASRVASLERVSRSRNRLLEERSGDAVWLEALEREMAELAVAVAAARAEAVARLAAAAESRRGQGVFPWAEARLIGDLEELATRMPALELEERHRDFLRANRARDAAAGRSAAGLRAADLLVRHGPKGIEARRCSTGEQKALLAGLMLAHARVVADASGLAPIVLLDEVAAHFDPLRRASLYAELKTLGCQTWMTGADPADFAELQQEAEIFLVKPGRVTALARR